VIISIFIFLIIFATAVVAFVMIYIQLRLGFFKMSFFEQPEARLIFMFVLSIAIGTGATIVGGKIAYRYIRRLLNAMRELSNGNFGIRIKMASFFRTKEIVDFEDEFNAMAKELGSIEMLRSDFINNFSHEFKTPIVSIRGFAKLLKESNLNEDERNEYLDIIISESERLSALSTNVLNLSRIENQAILTEKRDFHLSEQIRRAVLILETKWSEKDLDIDIDLDEADYFGSEELLNQVWLNLIDNAIKFSPQEGKIEITLRDSIQSVDIKVRDYGCGMNADTTSHIFDKFYQGDSSHASEGNGLGLAVADKIVTLHRGKISVSSEPGEGTLFVISLPRLISK
jgi:signal transduction histidine kinase